MSVFYTFFEDFPCTKSFFAGSVSFLPGSVTNFFTSWIRIRFKMIRIRHTDYKFPVKMAKVGALFTVRRYEDKTKNSAELGTRGSIC